MSFESIIVSLLKDPAFQAIIKSIVDNLFNQIVAGVHPVTAAQQATGQVSAAVGMHLTGNPVADLRSLVAGLDPAAITSPAPAPAPPPAGTYTS